MEQASSNIVLARTPWLVTCGASIYLTFILLVIMQSVDILALSCHPRREVDVLQIHGETSV